MPRAFPPSFYRLAAGDVPAYSSLDGSRRADVCVIGGGFTGLSAALHLAEAGADVVLVEAGEVAGGASGRNGGQIHSGQRRDVLWLEKRFGFERAKRLWDMAEEAKALVRALIERFAIPCELRAGVIEALHKPALIPESAVLVEALRSRYDYDRVELLDRAQTVAALGSERFAGALRDAGGGHLDPYRFALGLARAAAGLGASIHEMTPALSLGDAGDPVVRTARGEVRAAHVILATDGRSGGLERITRRRMVGINSFVVITDPLRPEGDLILPGGEAAADSRFVVRYWRKTADNRLIFGGGESSAGSVPADIGAFVRPHMLEIYPRLRATRIAHGWGGVVSVTAPRLPYVREIAPAVWAAGGYSGQGVALAPYVGKLLAEGALGRPEQLVALTKIRIPPLPGAAWLRRGMVSLAIWQGRLYDRL
ncbi:MAG: FAD-binding oxidoreductase [Rhizobiales bacterium]|nr:FAD-binding oxidoreductase [Hyphomicrobiales bacterium]